MNYQNNLGASRHGAMNVDTRSLVVTLILRSISAPLTTSMYRLRHFSVPLKLPSVPHEDLNLVKIVYF